ncbi:DUF6559 family protein [Vibrio campbellii]|uniref:DUF6559 family protein n=1 Tax=Vibrio campbellii TaxID=680 RepID=UPI0021095A67|nr:DUF6559 family protein [Vibrio campbellii]UTZ43390.1 hypothetical protein HB764_19000 [Vibrio campbellii]
MVAEIESLRTDVSNDLIAGGDYNVQEVLNLLGYDDWKGGRIHDDASFRFGVISRY